MLPFACILPHPALAEPVPPHTRPSYKESQGRNAAVAPERGLGSPQESYGQGAGPHTQAVKERRFNGGQCASAPDALDARKWTLFA
ncbi:hypothetical protein AEB_P1157 [Altererythrobacter sp. B11]|nr:hypothetical protein AEB_P1157 [Altererythrobacter sp. B11]